MFKDVVFLYYLAYILVLAAAMLATFGKVLLFVWGLDA